MGSGSNGNDKLDMYRNARPQMDTMDLLQWRSSGFVGWAIRAKTGGYFNHTGGVMCYTNLDVTDERRWTLHAVGGGLTVVFLSASLEAHHGEVWWYPLAAPFEKHRYHAFMWLMERAGVCSYDYGSLFRNLAGKVSADAANLFCSEAYFLAWHNQAVASWDEKLSHLRYGVNTAQKAKLFTQVGMKKYYDDHYPEEKPKAPTPAEICEVLGVYNEAHGACILKT